MFLTILHAANFHRHEHALFVFVCWTLMNQLPMATTKNQYQKNMQKQVHGKSEDGLALLNTIVQAMDCKKLIMKTSVVVPSVMPFLHACYSLVSSLLSPVSSS